MSEHVIVKKIVVSKRGRSEDCGSSLLLPARSLENLAKNGIHPFHVLW